MKIQETFNKEMRKGMTKVKARNVIAADAVMGTQITKTASEDFESRRWQKG